MDGQRGVNFAVNKTKIIELCNDNELPVLFDVDVLIIGGTLKGLAAAFDSAQIGKKVLLIEQRTYVGYEMTYCNRPWVEYTSQNSHLLKEWFNIEGGFDYELIPFRMSDLKIMLEDKLLNSGVEILYMTLPVSVSREKNNYLVTIANKSGRQIVRCNQVIDTTRENIIRHIISGSETPFITPEYNSKIQVRRTIEFRSVRQGYRDSYTIPTKLGVVGSKVYLYPGAHEEGHVFVDVVYSLPYPEQKNLQADMNTELIAKAKSFEVACFIKNNVEEFKETSFVQGSQGVLFDKDFDPVSALKEGLGITNENIPVLSSQSCNDNQENSVSKYTYSENSEFIESNPANEFIQVNNPYAPILWQGDVAVAGGGCAGAVAGYAAGGEGVKTGIFEMHHALGGTGTIGSVNAYWMSNDNAFSDKIDEAVKSESKKIGINDFYLDYHKDASDTAKYINQKTLFSKEFFFNREIKENVLADLCKEASVDIYLNCSTIGSLIEGCTVQGLVLATPYGMAVAIAKVIVDATGDGDVAAFSGASFTYGNNRDRLTMWTAMAPNQAPAQYKSDFYAVTDITDVLDTTRFILSTRRRDRTVYDHAPFIAPRESRHIHGDITITLDDQLCIRQFPDTVSIAYSNYDLKGFSVDEIVYLGVNPPNYLIEIPYRAYLPQSLENILVTGRALSCTHDALAAPRMQKDVQQFGGAVGIAAALAVKHDMTPRQLPVEIIQNRLMETGNLQKRNLHHQSKFPASKGGVGGGSNLLTSHLTGEITETASAFPTMINNLTGEEPVDWLNVSADEKVEDIPVFLKLCYAPPELVLPTLIDNYQSAAGKRKKILQKLLLWHRYADEEFTDEIVRGLREKLSENLPKRVGDIWFLVYSPDQGIMPEVLYDINMLYRLDSPKVLPIFRRIVDLLEVTRRDYFDRRQGIFEYIYAIVRNAERLCYDDFVPLLYQVLSFKEFANPGSTDGFLSDFMEERLLYLKMTIGRALARCGERKGLEVLASIAGDKRAVYYKSAIDEMKSITGKDFKWDYAKWGEYVSTLPGNISKKRVN